MKMIKLKNNIIFLLLSLFLPAMVSAQTAQTIPQAEDSLSLDWIIQKVIETHPMVQSAEEALNKADARIGLARSGYYPNVGISASVTNIGPVPKLTIPDMGTFSFVPGVNLNGELSVQQNIYDFGKTDQDVAVADEGKKLTEQSMVQVKQNLAMKSIEIFYALDFLQEAIKIKAQQLQTLHEHLDFVEKMKETGSATDYEVLSTKVKISAVESQQLDLDAMREVQLSGLNALLGLPAETFHNVKQMMQAEKTVVGDSLLDYALNNRNELVMAKEKEQLAAMQLDVVKLKNKPSLYLIANGGLKNGYIPEINKIRPNYVVGFGMNIPIFDGTKEKYNLLQAQSEVESIRFETEMTKRKISGEVVENETNVRTASKKISQAKLQLEQAEEALSLAEVSYKSGVITNLDLMDATTAVSESRLQLLKAKIDYTVNAYKLKSAIGEILY